MTIRSFEILQQACEKFGYQYQPADPKTDCLAKISNQNQHFFCSTGKIAMYPINPNFASQLANDKAWTNQVLGDHGFKVIRGDYFFIPSQLELALKYAEEIGYPVFSKPNKGSGGKLARICQNQAELEEHLTEATRTKRIMLVQELVKQPEYRIFVIDDKIQFIYQRQAADQAHTANLRNGGQIINYTESYNQETSNWTRDIQSLTKLRVSGIDIFASDINDPSTYTIIEINQNPSLKGIYLHGKENKALAIWQKVLHLYFRPE